MLHNAFFLNPLPPFRLDLTAWTLRRRTGNVLDRWDGQTYRRVLALPAGAVDVAVTQTGSSEAPKLRVSVEGQPLNAALKTTVSAALHRLLGLSLDLEPFYRLAAGEPHLRELAARFRGMKPPRFASVFEAVLNAIACQQLSLTVGLGILNRVITACGVTVGEAHAFPRPQDLVAVSPQTLRELGFSRQKARATLELSQAICNGTVDLESLATLPDDAALARLRQLHGVGRWTAEYVLLRGLGRLHIFPGDDVGGRNNLQHWLGLPDPLDYDSTAAVLSRWRPFGGLIYLHLLLERLADSGAIKA